MRLYIIGPVTGREDDNRAAFKEAASILRSAGHLPEMPHQYIPAGTEWQDAMRTSIQRMLDCDGVARLDDYHTSPGAVLENSIARALGIPIRNVSGWVGA